MNLELTPSVLESSLHSCLNNQLNLQSKVLKIGLPKRIVVAFSGGLDSHVLLHLFSRLSSKEFDVRAIYVNHGLQDQAANWGMHCQKTCDDLEIPFESINVDIKIVKGESIEELARKARYKALYENMQDDEVLVTAHHKNDQAETLLLQLFRGAGVQGLAAMPNSAVVKFKGKTYLHLRPLLSHSRESLEEYVNAFQLKHIEDPSNRDTSFDRNFLRQEIMPLLRERWQGIDKAISRTALIQAETKDLLDEVAEELLPEILSYEGNNLSSFITNNNDQGVILPPIEISKLLTLSKTKQNLLLRYWISKQGFTTPSAKKLQHIFSDVIESPEDKQPLVEWQGAELRRFQQCLYIMSPLSSHDASQVIRWDKDEELNLPTINKTLDSKLKEEGYEDITVRFRQGGETIEIPKRGNISLKNLFQELSIPSWLRSRLPLVYSGDKLIKIVGIETFKGHPPTF